VESSTLGMIVLTLIAVFGTAFFCFEHLATRQTKKKKPASTDSQPACSACAVRACNH